MAQERKYWVKESMRFNLTSMIDHVHCMQYGFEGDEDCKEYIGNGEVIIAGTHIRSAADCEDFLEELYDLYDKMFYKVTGKEYGRIKAIAEERQWIRYNTCISHGMSENDAAYAFTD